MMKYVPLGFKSDYSLLKSLLKIKDIVEFAVEANMGYVGILDDNPYAIMDFFDKCEKNDLKGVFGLVVKIGDNKIYLYIKNYEGYLNIIKINELVNEKKLTINDLFKYNAGLICVLPYENYNLYNRFKNVFEVFLGYRNSGELKNARLISKKLLFLNEVMYFKKEEASLLNILYKIAGSSYEEGDNYLVEATEFDVETIDNFVSEIDLSFEFGNRYIPQFCKTKEDSYKLLKSLAVKGLSKRLDGKVTDEYKNRLSYELDVINKMGFVDYFLIVYDYVKYAKKNDIMVGPGRGSAAGALVSYTLGITDIDPIKYDLLFERFLNPERITMPDIDIDFEDGRRNEVIDYVRKKYGEHCVSLIVAYGTLGSRQVIRDVGKTLGLEDSLIDALSKKIDAKKSLKENLKNAELVNFVKDNGLEKVYKISIRLEGLKRHTTIHAAGVVISSVPLLKLIPTFKTSDGILTGYTMEYLEKIGLLKMDFLAVRNLTTLHNTLKLVQKKDASFELRKIPLDDKNTYRLLSMANTDNVFQFETSGMKNFLKKLEPENFDDLAAAVALFRPGPMQNIDEYIARRKGQKSVSYPHPDLEPILKSTYGIIIYQEQIMQILSKMAGYSYAEADLIRRAMSKKKKDIMLRERERFIRQSVERKYGQCVAEEVYDLIVKFADYGFNKSHSVAYAMIGYQMAYLKANYMELFHLNTLNMNIGSETKTKDVIEDAKNKGLKIIKPSINKSSYKYVINDGKIILPLTSIKNISSAQSKVIVDNQPYEDYFDFFKKTNGKGINRSAVETLIKAGAMDEFGYSKNTLLANIDTALTYIELVGSLDESLVMKPELECIEQPDEEISEIELFGFYVSGHPASKFTGSEYVKIKDFASYMDKRISFVALVDKIKVINTKKGEKMAFLDISDETKSCSAVIFPRCNALIDAIEEGTLYKFKCLIGKRNDEIQAVIEEASQIKTDLQ